MFSLLLCSACQSSPDAFHPSAGDEAAINDILQVAYDEPAEPAASPMFVSPPTPAANAVLQPGVPAPSPGAPLPIDSAFVVRQAVASSAVIRDPNQFLAPGNPLLNNPEQVASSLDPTIYASSGFGVQAALAAMDAQLAAGAQWGQDALLQTNNFFTGNVAPANILVSESGSLYGRIDKPTAGGGLVSLVHNWNYTPNSLPSRDFNSRYVGFLRTEVRQPLLAGRGKEFTQIAGPASRNRGQLGRGVRVARLDQAVSLAEFETRLALLIKQAQDAYWDLWLASESRRSLAASRDSARALWDRVAARSTAGLEGGDAADEAQAEEAYLRRESALSDAAAEVAQREQRVRRLVGMRADGGPQLIPAEQPFDGHVMLDWSGSVATAIATRVELRQQRMRLESLQWQARAAASLTRPQLDLVAGAQVNGFGDDVYGSGGTGAFNGLLGGDHGGWNIGMEFSAPIGNRAAHAQRRHLEQRASKARQVLAAQEEEVRHEVAYSHREIDRAFRAMTLAARRRTAATRRQAAAEADAAAGRSSVDLVLRAQAALADAERDYLASLGTYNKSLVALKHREGTLLAEYNIGVE